MAPPTSRRSGHSRRAQYGQFTGYVVAAIGAVVGALLLGLSLWHPEAFSGLRGGAREAVAPVGKGTAVARTGGQNLFETIGGYFSAASKNAELRREAEIARIRIAEAEAVKQENRRLRALLSLQSDELRPVTVARLIGSTSSSTRRFGYLGAGRRDGVAVGMPVRSDRGVVGRVLEAGAKSSRVLLLTDSESVLPVRLARGDAVAFAEGRGDGTLRIKLINLGINPIKPGDLFVTSGAGGYYRPGIAVAIARKITSDGALASMVSDPGAADHVIVEPIWQPEAVVAARTPAGETVGGEPVPEP